MVAAEVGQWGGHRGSTRRGQLGGEDRLGQRPASIFFASVNSKSVGLFNQTTKLKRAPLLETLGNTSGHNGFLSWKGEYNKKGGTIVVLRQN